MKPQKKSLIPKEVNGFNFFLNTFSTIAIKNIDFYLSCFKPSLLKEDDLLQLRWSKGAHIKSNVWFLELYSKVDIKKGEEVYWCVSASTKINLRFEKNFESSNKALAFYLFLISMPGICHSLLLELNFHAKKDFYKAKWPKNYSVFCDLKNYKILFPCKEALPPVELSCKFYCKTNEDWYPSYFVTSGKHPAEGQRAVLVGLHCFHEDWQNSKGFKWRIYVAGSDDMSIGKSFDNSTSALMVLFYLLGTNHTNISLHNLKKIGFMSD